MFREIWDSRLASAQERGAALRKQLAGVDRKVEALLDRIADTQVDSVAKAYEGKVRKLQEERIALEEKIEKIGKPRTGFDEALRTPLAFLANPLKLWSSNSLEARQTVLKLAFIEKLVFDRSRGLRTPETALPFRVLEELTGGNLKMARPEGFEPPTP
ncbi:MAG: hypothetical protein AAGA68_01400 [Pseudomonadota bacterium]